MELENKTGKPGVDGIVRDPATGDIIVPDSPNGRVLRVSADALRIRVIATGLVRPAGAAIERDGSIIVADENGNAVPHLRADGRFESLGHFATPDDVAIDAAGNIFVASLGDNSIRMTEVTLVIDAHDGAVRLVAMIQNPFCHALKDVAKRGCGGQFGRRRIWSQPDRADQDSLNRLHSQKICAIILP